MHRDENDNDFYKKHIEPHYYRIAKFVGRLSPKKQLVDDVVQETMLDAWVYIDKMRTYDNIEAALIRFASNRLKKNLSKNKKHPELISLYELSGNELKDAVGKTVEDIVMNVETAKDFSRILGMIDKKYSRILILHHYYGLSLKEIAKMYRMNYSTVRSWHFRALKKFQEHCNETYYY